MFVSLHSLSKEKVPQMPHSSSGPGHLPLTQKIISSTLICGTKGKVFEKIIEDFFL